MAQVINLPDTGATISLSTARGRWILALLATVGFLDVTDASIVNVALPNIRTDLGFSIEGLQWVVSGYLLTYGGFMLLGGRMADLMGRRRILLAGTFVFAASSLVCGVAGDPGFLVGARLAQGLGAAFMVPAALSLLTTTFVGPERTKVLAVWGATAALGGAVGVLGGGLFTAGPGWRWIFYVNPPIGVVLMIAASVMFPRDRHSTRLADLDIVGGVLVTGAMLLLVHALVTAPDNGWGSARTLLQFFGTAVVFALFLVVEAVAPRPLIPLSIFRIRGLAAADLTAFIGVGGFVPMFFFLTFYMQTVLGYSPIKTGVSYLPITAGIAVSATISSTLIAKLGTRPVIAAGALVTGVGLFLLAHVPVDGSYASVILPGILVAALGIGGVFVGTTTAANDGVPPAVAGLAAALVNACQQTGGALGIAIFSALATTRTNHLLSEGATPPHALTDGFHVAFTAAAIFLAVAALIALRAANTRGEPEPAACLTGTARPSGTCAAVRDSAPIPSERKDADIDARDDDWVDRNLVQLASELVGQPLTLVDQLTGGIHARTLLVAGGGETYVIRVYPRGESAVAREIEVLPRLEALGELVPKLIAHDESSSVGPLIVTTRVPGGHPEPGLSAMRIAEQMAATLVKIHALDGTGLEIEEHRVPSDSGAIGDAASATKPTSEELVLTHRDYWSGNALWDGDLLTGVVDWSGACLATRGLDLAWCRQDLVLLGAPEAAAHLLDSYQRHAGMVVPDIYSWDLWAGANAHARVEEWAPNYRGIGRPELSGDVLRKRLDAWNTALLDGIGCCAPTDGAVGERADV